MEDKIQEAYEKTVLTEAARDFGPDDRKNRGMTKLLVKELVDALEAADKRLEQDKILIPQVTKALKKGKKWLKS